VKEILSTLSTEIQNGNDAAVRESTREAIDAGIAPSEILDRALLPAMAVVGDRFRVHEIFLPDVLLAARAMHAAMALLKPLLVRDDVPPAGRVVVGTVVGDVHDIGKNLVATLLQGAGFEVIDLGTDVSPDRFVDAAVDAGAPVIGMSALLTTTMIGMRDVVDLVRARGLAGTLATIVGGAPVTAEFAREIGADAWAADAPSAVDRIRTLIAGR
jgi:5-methyltetrahydrofolate--homocysteine methyltransferase